MIKIGGIVQSKAGGYTFSIITPDIKTAQQFKELNKNFCDMQMIKYETGTAVYDKREKQ